MIKINTILTSIWKYKTVILLGLTILFFILFLRQCNEAQYQKKKRIQNREYYKDSLQTRIQKNGDLISEKATLVAKTKELKKENKELYKEVKQLQKEGSKPKVVTQTKIEYKDTGSTKNKLKQPSKNNYELNFNYKSQVLDIKGKSKFRTNPQIINDSINLNIQPQKTVFDSINIRLGLTVGVKEDEDGINRVFAKPIPNNKNIKITNIDAVELEEYYKSSSSSSNTSSNKNKLGVGPYIGYGVTLSQNTKFHPTIGVALQYDLFQF